MTEPNTRPGIAVWPLVVIGLLTMSFTICGITVYAALKDPASTVVVDNYYQRALDWDANREAWRSPSQAGWVVTSSVFTRDAHSIVRVEIAGRSSDEGLHAVVYHKARANNKVDLMLVRTAPGVYEALLPSNLPGLWKVEARDETLGVKFDTTLELESQ